MLEPRPLALLPSSSIPVFVAPAPPAPKVCVPEPPTVNTDPTNVNSDDRANCVALDAKRISFAPWLPIATPPARRTTRLSRICTFSSVLVSTTSLNVFGVVHATAVVLLP
jgi:hypothetical protein